MVALQNIKGGLLVWITGLPGAGKSTLAQHIFQNIQHQTPSVIVDGDVFRKIMGGDLGYSVEDRKANAYRIVRMCKYLTEHNLTVLCPTVSLYTEIHQWNRENHQKMIEVFIDVPHHELLKRDQKGLYTQAQQGQVNNLIGLHQNFDIPPKPELIIKNDRDLDRFLSHSKLIEEMILKHL